MRPHLLLPPLASPCRPDIVHCHDWQSAPVAWLDHGSSKCAFTIHNLNYGADLIGQVRLLVLFASVSLVS